MSERQSCREDARSEESRTKEGVGVQRRRAAGTESVWGTVVVRIGKAVRLGGWKGESEDRLCAAWIKFGEKPTRN